MLAFKTNCGQLLVSLRMSPNTQSVEWKQKYVKAWVSKLTETTHRRSTSGLSPTQPDVVSNRSLRQCVPHLPWILRSVRLPFLFSFSTKYQVKGTEQIRDKSNHGKVAGVPVAQRTAFATAMTDGRSAPEVDGGKQAEQEISALWKFVSSNFKKTWTWKNQHS